MPICLRQKGNLMKDIDKLSLCGLYCGGCKNFKENLNCIGCRNEKELLNDCPTRSCCIAKGLQHCGLCEAFPCTELSEFYADGMKHHHLAYENMLVIKEIGEAEWLAEQGLLHTCDCGGKKCGLHLNVKKRIAPFY